VPQQVVDWIGQTYQVQGEALGSRRLINLYIQQDNTGSQKYNEICLSTPGTALWQDLTSFAGGGVCRAIYLSSVSPYDGGTLYSVFGQNLVKSWVDIAGLKHSQVISGLVLDTANPRVSMVDNGKYLGVVDGSKMVFVDLFTDAVKYPDNVVVVGQTPGTFPIQKPFQIGYLNNRFICITQDTDQAGQDLDTSVKANCLWYSELGLDGCLHWGDLNFVSAEGALDGLLSLQIVNGEAWTWSRKGYQIWRPTADYDTPYMPASGTASTIGISAPWASTSIGNDVFWLGSAGAGHGIIYRGDGYSGQRISTHGIEYMIQQSGASMQSAIMFSYQDQGHTFAVLEIPSSTNYPNGLTLACDLANGTWAERVDRDPYTGQLSNWQVRFCAYAYGKLIVGNGKDPVLMVLDNDYYTDYTYIPFNSGNSKPIYRMIQGPIYGDNLKYCRHLSFQVDCTVGWVELNNWGSDPLAFLQWSNDGGNTWGNMIPTSLGKTGEYNTRIRWVGLGTTRNRVYRMIITEPNFVAFGQAVLNIGVANG